jgi:H+/Cl- antiporter ClcA/predicted transcriptional regulator
MTPAGKALRAATASCSRWVNRTGYLPKWISLGVTIGAIAGIGAVAFYEALRLATHMFIGIGTGFHDPANQLNSNVSALPIHSWLIPVIVGSGGLVSGFLVFRFAPEAEGPGMNAAIDAVHTNPRKIRPRVVLVKLMSSAVTLGSGGSGGREGAAAHISAGVGSMLSRTLDLDEDDARMAVSVAMGAGIGAIFGAPLGGAVTAADILYRDDFEPRALVPGLIASATAYTVFGSIQGFEPMFRFTGHVYTFHTPMVLLWFAALGILCGLIGLLYRASFYCTIAIANRVRVSRIVKPALGGVLVGLLALAIPQVLGTSYGWVQHALTREQLLSMPLWIVLALPLAKIVATSLSIGTGGSGGIFGPGVVIGAFTGAAVWRLAEPYGLAVPSSPAPFVIAAMMACFGAISRAPLAMMLMIAEMTGNVTMLAPAMVTVGIAYLIVHRGDRTIYGAQLHDRGESPAARLNHGTPLLDRISARAVMSPPFLVLDARERIAEVRALLTRARVPGVPVVDKAGRFIGSFEIPGSSASADEVVSARADPAAPSVADSANLSTALAGLVNGRSWLTVVGDDRRVVGVLTLADIARAYRSAASAVGQQPAGVAETMDLHEVRVAPDTLLIGAGLDGALLRSFIVLSVRRADTELPLTDTLRLRVGDAVGILAPSDRAAEVQRLAAAVGRHGRQLDSDTTVADRGRDRSDEGEGPENDDATSVARLLGGPA